MQVSSDCHMCAHEIASPHAQSKCLLQDCAVVGMTTVPAQFTIMEYPHLDMRNTCLHGNMCPSCNVENLQYTKKFSTQQELYATIVSPWWLRLSFRLTDLRDSSRASGGPMSHSSSRSRGLLKPKSRMTDRGQEMETSIPKTPAKSGGSVAPTTPPKAAGAKMIPTPPPGPPPGYVPAPKAKVFLRPAVPRPPPAKRIAAPYPPPVAPKDATPQGGCGSTILKAHVRPKPPTPPARPSRAPHVVDAIPAIPEATGSTSSGSTELPKAAAGEPPRQFRLQELLIISRGTRPECVQLTRRPPELQDPTWDVSLKSLHQLDNPQRDRTLQGHIGIGG